MRWGLVIVLAASAAYADSKHDAAQLFEEGRALAGKAQYDEACERFERSNELDRAAGTEVNLGDCHEHLGHLAEAWRWFSDAAALWDDAHDNRVDYAKKRADLLEPRLGTIIIKLPDPDGATVTIAGRSVVAKKKIREHVDPGDVDVKVVVPGAPTYERSVSVEAGATKTLKPEGAAAPDEPEPEPVPVRVRPPAPEPERETAPNRGMWRGAFVGSTVVAVAGVGLILYGRSQIDDAKDRLCRGGAYQTMPNCQFPPTITQSQVDTLNAQGDRGRTFAIAGEITTVLGAAFAVVAGYEGFFAHSSVVVAPAPGGASVSFAW